VTLTSRTGASPLGAEVSSKHDVVVLGAGIAGCSTALRLTQLGYRVALIDRNPFPASRASRHNEGKLHLGYIYAADPDGDTYKGVMRGSLEFLHITQRLTGIASHNIPRTQGFVYAVPRDSQLTSDQVYAHLARVDEYLLTDAGPHSNPAFERARPMRGAMTSAHFSDEIQAVFQTSEIAIDPNYVANIYAAAVLAEPNIDFLGEHEIVTVERHREAFMIITQCAADEARIPAPAVANCLWQNRVHIDTQVGQRTTKPWLWRWKATLSFATPDRLTTPPATLMLGPYGDYVPYSSGRSYLSWYPSGAIGITSDGGADPLRSVVSERDDARIRRESFAGLGRYLPELLDLPEAHEKAIIGGGYIMALGTTDVDDPLSGLHQRTDIGPTIDGTWLSLETGKLCTAPSFGLQAAEMLHDALR